MLIRRGTIHDVEAILSLVKELAHYERAPDQVIATVEDYQEGISNDEFEAIVCESNGQIIGMALYYLTWSTWRGRMMYLEDLVVRESMRRSGIGQKLFEAVLNRASALSCRIVKWQVLDWNDAAIHFYEKNGAEIEKDWWNVKILL